MALVTQYFNLGGNIKDYYKAKKDYEYLQTYEGYDEFMANYKGNGNPYEAYGKELQKSGQNVLSKNKIAQKSAKIDTIATAKFLYNYTAKTTRFGLRGQDIQDQLNIQDKMVNKAFGITGAALVGGVPAAALATVATVVSEAVNVSVQNKAYEYRKTIDEQQKSIMQERIGRAVYNSSRRA